MIFTSICYKRWWLSVSFLCKLCVSTSLFFFIFLEMTSENFSSLSESTMYHVPCTSAWINPHYRQRHPAWNSFIAFALFVIASHQFCSQLIFIKSPSLSNKFLIYSRLLQWMPNWSFEMYFLLVLLQICFGITLQF